MANVARHDQGRRARHGHRDGLNDGAEAGHGADPLVPDTDGDTLNDGQEVTIGTNPAAPDSDGDGVNDATEVNAGTDPNNELDYPSAAAGLQPRKGLNVNSPGCRRGHYRARTRGKGILPVHPKRVAPRIAGSAAMVRPS